MADARRAHDLALQYGGRPGVLDAGRVHAAINRPYSGYFRSIASKAAALFEAIANNHGFVDGNKRTAILLTDLLIKRSGYRLTPSHANEDLNWALEELAVAVARGELRFADIADWFKKRLTRRRSSQSPR
ncbi:MAG: type II toxin-antitoxin system death-on-curing family toxin [Bacteroidota bacterium]|jgi:death-on-curing protein